MRFKKLDIQPNDRIHMTDSPKFNFIDQDIDDNSMSGIGKPRGLWYSMGREWMEWIEREKMDWWKKYIYKVEINSKKILFLDTERKVKLFSKAYQRPGYFSMNIHWGRIAEKYSGIEFNPYFWHLRFEIGLLWYYGIDVPSGCIWNKAGIKSITRLN